MCMDGCFFFFFFFGRSVAVDIRGVCCWQCWALYLPVSGWAFNLPFMGGPHYHPCHYLSLDNMVLPVLFYVPYRAAGVRALPSISRAASLPGLSAYRWTTRASIMDDSCKQRTVTHYHAPAACLPSRTHGGDCLTARRKHIFVDGLEQADSTL